MKEFTFVTITYNHAQYILAHLESICYQVEHFGQDYEVDLVITDDGSKDETVELVQFWLTEKKSLFRKVTFLHDMPNVGTIANLHRGLQAVTTKQVKYLAGDDLYYRYNLFEVVGKWDMCATPTLPFQDDETILTDHHWNHKRLLLLSRKGNVKGVRKLYQYEQVFQAPGMLMSADVQKDQKMWEFLSQFMYIEDVPMWYYLLNKREPAVTFHALAKPYILYRNNSGISKSKGHEKHNIFTEELERQRKLVGFRRYRYPLRRNPYCYFFKIRSLILQFIQDKSSSPLRELNEIFREETVEGKTYLHAINQRAEELKRRSHASS